MHGQPSIKLCRVFAAYLDIHHFLFHIWRSH